MSREFVRQPKASVSLGGELLIANLASVYQHTASPSLRAAAVQPSNSQSQCVWQVSNSSLRLWRGRLIMSFPPNLLIEVYRGSTGDRDRRPGFASDNPCDQHDLADMVSTMCQ